MKRIAILLSMCIFLMMGFTAEGAGNINSITTGNGGIVSVSSDRGTAVLSDTFEDPLDQAEADRINGMLSQPLSEVLQLKALSIYGLDTRYIENQDISAFKFLTKVHNLKLDADPAPANDNPVKVRFVCNNITPDIEVFVLHKCSEHAWELLKTEGEDNMISAAFHSASPVALVYRNKREAVSAGVSPKTGENNWEIIAVTAAIGCLLIGIYAIRKSKRKWEDLRN